MHNDNQRDNISANIVPCSEFGPHNLNLSNNFRAHGVSLLQIATIFSDMGKTDYNSGEFLANTILNMAQISKLAAYLAVWIYSTRSIAQKLAQS